jgi:sulfur-oxidizing protein SoxZ
VARALIRVPPRAKRGEVLEIRTLAPHIMETGFRHDESGALVPRNIITTFSCSDNGVEIFRAQLSPAISANPYIGFTTVADESGMLEFHWSGDNGFSLSASARIRVD